MDTVVELEIVAATVRMVGVAVKIVMGFAEVMASSPGGHLLMSEETACHGVPCRGVEMAQ